MHWCIWLLVVPEGLGVLSAYMQLWGGGGAGGVVVTQGRVLEKLRERNPAAICRRLSSCWTTTHNKNRGWCEICNTSCRWRHSLTCCWASQKATQWQECSTAHKPAHKPCKFDATIDFTCKMSDKQLFSARRLKNYNFGSVLIKVFIKKKFF